MLKTGRRAATEHQKYMNKFSFFNASYFLLSLTLQSLLLTHSLTLTVKIHFYPNLLGILQKQKQNTIHNDIMYFCHPHCFNIYISIRSRYTYTIYHRNTQKISYFHLHSFLYFSFLYFLI